jgi:ribosomal protein S18 acetylase RimI-like enzyme
LSIYFSSCKAITRKDNDVVYNSVMEIANLEKAVIRLAAGKDAPQILRLINESAYSHIHADWHLPGDWLDTPGFVVSETQQAPRLLSGFGRGEPEIAACLAVAADPEPAAWVRIAAIRRKLLAQETLAGMLEAVLPFLRKSGVTELGWLAVDSWPDEMLPDLGFRRENWITTFSKEGVDLPTVKDCGVQVRPARLEEMELLAAIEAEAFDPLWRHSADGLRLAYGQAICFDVAQVDDSIVGFQYSASNYRGTGAHLVRITVRPSFQGAGVGSALMKAAIEHYGRVGIKRISLNTQINNISSHRLYEKFGFNRTGDQMPVWGMDLGRGFG